MSKAASIPVWRHIGASPAPASEFERMQVLVVGAGPVGLTVALDLARRGHKVTILNKLDFVPASSKAICFAKRTLDIWNRLGVADAMVERGVVWNVGKVFHGEGHEPIYQFDLLPMKQQKMPAFINLQQYYVEEILAAELSRLPEADIRWGHEVIAVEQNKDTARVQVSCSQGRYAIEADWLIACDGSKSPVRQMLGLDFDGRVFEDNFLIADVKFNEARPAERWFWFDPPFNAGQSALLHKQPDDVWRLDFQLGWGIDRSECIRPENVEPLVRGMLGSDVEFTPEWYSVYTFQCRRMQRFVHDRVIFAGDSAHLVSPFGARGCNGGVVDADNLGWKLDLVLRGEAPETLIETYNDEAIAAADENIQHSTRSTDFITPKTRASRALRDAVLTLARDHEFARPFVNSGRLSVAVAYGRSTLSTPDEPGSQWAGIPPGSVTSDAPSREGWLLDRVGGRFVLLTRNWNDTVPAEVARIDIDTLGDDQGLIASRYDLLPGSAYLIRPDQYVAARWRHPTPAAIASALRRAKGIVSWQL